MNSAQALAAWNRKILEAYSRRTVDALRAILPLRLALPRIESFLAENVAKEAEKMPCCCAASPRPWPLA